MAATALVLTTVGGGCTGVLAATQLFGGLPSGGLRYALLILIVSAVYSFVTAAGLWFVYDATKIRPMVFAFALQIPWVDLPGFRYQVYSLLYAAITFGPPHGNGRVGTYAEWSANLGAHAELRIGGLPEGNWSVGVNLFAFLITLFLLGYSRKLTRSSLRFRESVATDV